MSTKRIEIATGVSVSSEVRTSITQDEYAKCVKLIPSNVTVVENSEKGLVTLVQSFKDVKKVILDGFNALDKDTVKTLALREYKTRDFQDNARSELRGTLGLTTSMSSGMRELMRKIKENPEKFESLKKEFKI